VTLFIVIGIFILVATLAFLFFPVFRELKTGDGGIASRQTKALKQALDAGVITQEEFDLKSAQISESNAENTEGKTQVASSTKLVIACVVILFPVAAFILYRSIGQPDALSQSPSPTAMTSSAAEKPAAAVMPGMDMTKAIDSLTKKLEKNPDDVDGWLLLGRAYKSMDRNGEAKDALGKAYAMAPERPEIEVAYAEALALMNPTRRIDGKPLEMIKNVLKKDPLNQDALWLYGMSDYQAGKYQDAITSWEKIRIQLAPDSDVLGSVTSMITDAKTHLDANGLSDSANTAGMASVPPAASGTSGPQIKVHVTLSASRIKQISPGDTLFIYAKAASGPPMPIAIQKLEASALPATVILTDGMGMMPNMNLSQFPQVIIAARISKSGNAIPQSGDLQAVSAPVNVNGSDTVELTIDQLVK
jgi:cytochrome c-type biogenesis protein CcmH